VDLSAASIVLVLVYVAVVVAIIALPIWVLREMHRRGDQLDRIEQRLNEIDRRSRGDARPD
jgi:cytochrome oxidase assembly protein ShyY1